MSYERETWHSFKWIPIAMFEESLVVVALWMTSQWRDKVLSFSDMDSFWCRWAWNWTVNELDSTCYHHKASQYTSNLFLTNNRPFIFGLTYRIYREETESRKSIIWLLTSLWRHFKWERHQIWTQPRLGIQEDVCKVSLLYLCALRRYLRRSKGGNFLPPPQCSGWRVARRPSGCRVKSPYVFSSVLCWTKAVFKQ